MSDLDSSSGESAASQPFDPEHEIQLVDRQISLLQHKKTRLAHDLIDRALQRWQVQLRNHALKHPCPSDEPCVHRYHLQISPRGFGVHVEDSVRVVFGSDDNEPWTQELYTRARVTATPRYYAADREDDLLPRSKNDRQLINDAGIRAMLYKGRLTGLDVAIDYVVSSLTWCMPVLHPDSVTETLNQGCTLAESPEALKKIVKVLKGEPMPLIPNDTHFTKCLRQIRAVDETDL